MPKGVSLFSDQNLGVYFFDQRIIYSFLEYIIQKNIYLP